MRYDLVVIGAGPAGWSAALQGAKLGLSVAIIEKGLMLGGACVRTGTLPSKTLRHTVLQLVNSRRAAQLGIHSTNLRPLTIQDLRGPRDQLIASHQETIRAFLDRNKVDVLAGSASFAAPDRIRVATRHGEDYVEARHVVIATGSRPRRPDSIPFDDHVIVDSDSLLKLDTIPKSLAVLGSGVIGCEYATMFATLGCKVTVIDRREKILRFLDGDILDSLCHAMRAKGIRIMQSESVTGVRIETQKRFKHGVVQLDSGRTVRAERVLVAAGRVSNVEPLDLGRIGLTTTETGLIKVDETYQTEIENVYAVGDVIGFPALASTSMHQGRLAVLHAAGQELPPPSVLPMAIFTIPEISAVGLTEEECRERGLPYEVGVARTGETPRGQIVGDDGLVKLIFRRDDKTILGVHMIGVAASELIHVGMMVVHLGGTIDDLLSGVFNYPTMSEVYRIAALDGLNRL
ncbi:MAG: Si-specific NAD(P)(+) transhydrogenase [Spirochaetaceae bacterium]|nr:Si-specific NAD(P)(+) transhydrogenase [Myxococcales bacterium]MCB9726410.1 Si-specific NAD(P)(+) transhydrogenase [Spirochaetaceae bacterium]